MSDYYDREGNPISFERYIEITKDQRKDPKRVALDVLPGDVRISTVWLGLDHGWGEGLPVIFETLVFGGPLDGEMERYTSEARALAGHATMVERVKDAARSPSGGGEGGAP